MPQIMSPEEAYSRLIDGNSRFCDGQSAHPHSDRERRHEVIEGQCPFATVITCSDSRVPPEIIFDCGIGDLFVIRVAGNILDPVVLGSVLYATEHLGCSLVVILGHESCGAVTAALQPHDSTENEPSAIIEILENVRGNIPKTLASTLSGPEKIHAAVGENLRSVTEALLRMKEFEQRINGGTLQIKPALYTLESGEVSW